jgi:hypothetical protein
VAKSFTLSSPVQADVLSNSSPLLVGVKKVALIKATEDGRMAQPDGFQKDQRFFSIEDNFRLSSAEKAHLKEELDKHNAPVLHTIPTEPRRHTGHARHSGRLRV